MPKQELNILSSSKAQVLETLRSVVNCFTIPDFIFFTCKEYRKNKTVILKNITSYFSNKRCLLAVRSSAADEDGLESTLAGAYESILDVSASDVLSIDDSIESVMDSFDRDDKFIGDDEIIVQTMLENTIMSGVVFTHDLNTGAPYYVINYDDVSGLTNTVTAGDGEYANRTLYLHRSSVGELRSIRFQRLLEAIQELESVVNSQFLDIEFAIDQNLQPYLLQVRSITTKPNWNRGVTRRVDNALEGIRSFVTNKFRPIPSAYGKTTVLGQMPDWNPAEMIGRAPRAMAFSLYKTLITDHAWRIAREEMGYAVPTGQALMVSLAGQPFIDTRLSFHSYLPKDIKPIIAEKLVDAWVKSLSANPDLHDKIEFNVAITAFSFDIDEKITVQTGDQLDDIEKQQFKELLREQTNTHIIGEGTGSIAMALSSIEALLIKQKNWHERGDNQSITTLYEMIDDCTRLGTVPFSILARHSFIARTLLLSLQYLGVFTKDDVYCFQAGIKTVASDLVEDMNRLRKNEISRNEFLKIYGHLRPGTYDILSLRYDQVPDLGVSDVPIKQRTELPAFELNDIQRKEINKLLIQEQFVGVDADSLLEYIKQATVAREHSKFVFTRTVSDMLELIAEYGEHHGLSREEMSHISVTDLLAIAVSSVEDDVEDRLRQISEYESKRHALSSVIRMPQVLFDEAGVHVVPFQVSYPNFISNKKITASCIKLLSGETPSSLTGKIVLIENADPGFDWIFGYGIAGLITKYGGVNSHMAIRCAEFGIPAAIGCGEQRFESLNKVEQITLDCAASVIQTLH